MGSGICSTNMPGLKSKLRNKCKPNNENWKNFDRVSSKENAFLVRVIAGDMVTTKKTPTHNSADTISIATAHSTDVPPQYYEETIKFFNRVGVGQSIKKEHNVKDSFSNLAGGVLKVISIERGKISSLLYVKAPVLNIHGGMHGGAVAAVAERVAIACARTVVGKDKDIFLGELSASYLSAAPHNAELIVDGSVIRSGRNLTVVAVNFRLKDPGRLVYMIRATFYNQPISSL